MSEENYVRIQRKTLESLRDDLADLRNKNKRLRMGLEFTRNSVAVIMAMPGHVVNDIDRDAKLSALQEIQRALFPGEAEEDEDARTGA